MIKTGRKRCKRRSLAFCRVMPVLVMLCAGKAASNHPEEASSGFSCDGARQSLAAVLAPAVVASPNSSKSAPL